MSEVEVENVAEDKQKSIEKAFKLIGLIIFIFGLIITFIYAFTAEDFAFGWIIIVIIGLILISGILIFFFKFKEKFGELAEKHEKKTQIPEPVPIDIIKDKLRNKALKNRDYMNEVKEIVRQREEVRGELTLCQFDVKSLYKNEKGSERYVIIYNLNYPNKDPTVLPDPSPAEIKSAVNSMSIEKDIPIREKHRIIEDPFKGTRAEEHEKGPVENKQKKKKKKGDLE